MVRSIEARSFASGVAAVALPVTSSQARAEAEEPEETTAKISSAPALPPLETKFVQYGVALASEFVATPGAMCKVDAPCVLGSGGGVVLHAGLRSASSW